MIFARGRCPRGLTALSRNTKLSSRDYTVCSLWNWSYYSMGVGGFDYTRSWYLLNFFSFMPKLNKIYLLDKDRAIEILWLADSFYDELWYCNYSLVGDKMTKSEWMIISPYFDPNNYRADQVLETLKYNHPLENCLQIQ